MTRFASGPFGNFTPNSGLLPTTKNYNYFHSGPLSGSTAKSGPIDGKNRNLNFFSGLLGKSSTKSGQISGLNKISKKFWLSRNKSTRKKPPLALTGTTQAGIFNGNTIEYSPSNFNSNCKLLDAPPETLGSAALALHYANVIIVIEKFVASPHLISHDARDVLYNMLSASVRATLREKLKPYMKSLGSSVIYDDELAGEWTEAMASILEWLALLAHNTIRWQSERSFVQRNVVSRTNVLLVQTLYFANQEKIEATDS